MKNNVALPGIMLQANDAPAGGDAQSLDAHVTQNGTFAAASGAGRRQAMMHPYHAKLARMLDRMGGLYGVNDILRAIASGKMQSFVDGDSGRLRRSPNFLAPG